MDLHLQPDVVSALLLKVAAASSMGLNENTEECQNTDQISVNEQEDPSKHVIKNRKLVKKYRY